MTLERCINTIQHKDCVAGMNGLPAGTVDLAFADPPFNIGYEYDVYHDRKKHQHYLDWSREWISAVHRVLKPTGTFWLAIGDEYAAELKLLSQEFGFHCRSWVIWYYTFGVNCKAKFSRSHVHLFHFVKDAANFTFRGGELENRIPSARQLVYNDNRANPSGRLPDDTWILRPQDLADCLTPDEDTWYFPRVAGTFKEREGFHGCQMPEQLLGRIIRLCSHENEIVLDPFAGSATTLVVAKKLYRLYLGFELSPEYVARGKQRLENARRGDPLDGAAEPLMSAPATPATRGASRKKKAAPPQATAAQTPAEQASPAPPTPTPSVEQRSLDGTLEATLEKGLVEAFRRVCDGYSLDRLVADPDLNEKLAAECRSLGLPGDRRTWNRRLFNYRKAGKLVDVRASRRTEFSWESCDPFVFASEIAMTRLLANGCGGLDEILCEPSLAERFDQLAQRLAPGFTPLEYRWAALKLRKEAKVARTRSLTVAPVRWPLPTRVSDLDWNALADTSAVYLVTTGGVDGRQVYAGGTLNLRTRLRRHFGDDQARSVWQEFASSDDLQVSTWPVEPSPSDLLAYISALVRLGKPLLNYRELGIA